MRQTSTITSAAGLLIALSLGGVGGGLLHGGAFTGTAMAAEPGAASAQAPKTGSVNPNLGSGPADQKSLPSSATPPTTTKHTGATNQSHKVKSMNKKAKAKVETEGK
ncbi:MAG: hypothetical protein B7Z80_05890 [Rhodospirillales bacterium 20-64-7]|nr:MAG: hypothetical protein B7Z80_05890 [Rhodospirillales bacterium 20-64-7]HQT77214.1 hypothetical protein [Rhodopila sp.]